MGDALVVPEPGFRHTLLSTPAGSGIPSQLRCGVQAEGELTVVELSGELPRGWSVNLTRGLAAHGVSLVNGQAREVQPRLWLARLELDPGYAGGAELDFLALATRATQSPALAEPKLLDFGLAPTPERGLSLEVHAWDGVGLLAGVLDRVADAGLEPTELLLETEDECAFHSLLLFTPGRGEAGPRQSRRLALALTRLLIEA